MEESHSYSSWLASEWSACLASAVEMMTEARPAVQPGSKYPSAAVPLLWFSMPLTAAPGAAVFAGASEECWTGMAAAALSAAGLTESSPDALRGVYLEILAQAAAGLARSLTQRLGRPVSALPVMAVETVDAAGASAIEVNTSGQEPRELSFAWNPALGAALEATVRPPRLEAAPSRTLDLLMEVELPVSVSFGRAELPLRDVLKLNSGSIVELNRTISDPVEIIVNNCVIARGEVVVVDGNYGVRIQQVISREERLRTLK